MDINQLFAMLDKIPKDERNEKSIEEARKALEEGQYQVAIDKINELFGKKEEVVEQKEESKKEDYDDVNNDEDKIVNRPEETSVSELYPEKLKDNELEETYIGMLLNNPKAMSMYYILFDDCYFENPEFLNMYKSIE